MGEEIQGTWTDKRTGKKIIVRDSIIQGNDRGEDEMVVVTSIGLIPLNTFSQNYIKMSDEDYGQQGILPEVSAEGLNAAINQGVNSEDKIAQQKSEREKLLEMPISNGRPIKENSTAKVETAKISSVVETPKNINYSLIEKVMNKYQNAITMAFETNPDEWPKSELQMLINTFDVTADEICDYIIDKYLNKKSLLEPFKEYLMTVLEIDK